MEAHADARVVIASSAAALPDYAMGDQYGHGQGSPPRFDLHHLRCATVYVSDWVYLLLLPVSLTARTALIFRSGRSGPGALSSDLEIDELTGQPF